jgi:hypothetical protein
LVLYTKGKPGGLIVVHQDDLATVAVELAGPEAPSRLAGRADSPSEPSKPGTMR